MTDVSSELQVERFGKTLALTLNCPGKMNALSSSLVEALLSEIEEAKNSGVRLMVLKGNGKNFSAGFDFSDWENQTEGDLLLRFIRIEQLLAAVYNAPFETLALAHGANFGAGVDLICSCSLRISDADATFRMPGLAFGLVLGTRRLADRIGSDAARSVLRSTKTFDASFGISSGFLTECRSRAEWDQTVQDALNRTSGLSDWAVDALNRNTRLPNLDADLAELVLSASQPGLKDRIALYRKPSTRTA